MRRPVLAATPDGQLWLAWVAENIRTTVIQARQIRGDGSTLGSIVTTQLPDTGGAFASVGDLQIAAQGDRVDLVITYNGGHWHSQVLAPSGMGAISGRVGQENGGPIAAALVEACPQPKGLLPLHDVRHRRPLPYRLAEARLVRRDGVPARRALPRRHHPAEPARRQRRRARPTRRHDAGAGSGAEGDHARRAGQSAAINGIPVIRRNVPLLMEVDAPTEADDVVVIMWHGPAPNEQPRQVLEERAAEVPGGGSPPLAEPEQWKSVILAALIRPWRR